MSPRQKKTQKFTLQTHRLSDLEANNAAEVSRLRSIIFANGKFDTILMSHRLILEEN